MITLKGKLTIRKKQTMNERLMAAYDRGYRDGYEVGLRDWDAYEKDMADIAEERKEVGVA